MNETLQSKICKFVLLNWSIVVSELDSKMVRELCWRHVLWGPQNLQGTAGKFIAQKNRQTNSQY